MSNEPVKGPIFIGGAGRSGTSLLRVILDSHPNIMCGPEFKVLGEVTNLASLMTSEALMPVMQAYQNTNDDVTGGIRTFIDGLFAKSLAASGKRRWAEKTPHNVLMMPRLASVFPDAKFIHVIRDGRDVACSLIGMDWGDPRTGQRVAYVQNIANAAAYWNQVVRTGLRDAAHPRLAGRVMAVKYEALVSQPESTLRGLMQFLDEPWDDGLLAHQEQKHVHIPNESSTHQVTQPIYQSSQGRWKSQMSEQDRRDFVAAAGMLLTELGYVSDAWSWT